MERELSYLLADLCTKWGFCIPPSEGHKVRLTKSYNAQEFAKHIVSAEGMNPEYETKWVKLIANKFIQRFGVEEIDSSTFNDRIKGYKE